jgi:hypothetical protein
VGNWTEIPAGGGRDPSAGKPRATMPDPSSCDPYRSSSAA